MAAIPARSFSLIYITLAIASQPIRRSPDESLLLNARRLRCGYAWDGRVRPGGNPGAPGGGMFLFRYRNARELRADHSGRWPDRSAGEPRWDQDPGAGSGREYGPESRSLK